MKRKDWCNNKIIAISLFSILILNCFIIVNAKEPINNIISNSNDDFTFTTTSDFENGTFNGAYSSSNNLYSNIYEDWNDCCISNQLKRIATGASWIDYTGYARQVSGIAYGIGYHYSGNVTIDSINNFNSSCRFNYNGYLFNQWRNNNIFGLTYKNSSLSSTNYGEKIFFAYYQSPDNFATWQLRISYVNTSGTLLYWNGAIWSSSISYVKTYPFGSIVPLNLNCSINNTGTGLKMRLVVKDTNEFLGETSEVPYSSFKYTDNIWGVVGNCKDTGYDVPINNIIWHYQISTNYTNTWTSPSITPPDNKTLKQIGFSVINGTNNSYISKVEILNATDSSIIDTSNNTLSETGIYIKNDFDFGLNATLNTDYKMKLYFVNDIYENILTISDIYGSYSSLNISDINMTPELNITYFGDYYIYTNVSSLDTVDTVLANISGINGEELPYWRYYVNGTPVTDTNISKEMTHVSNDTYMTMVRPDEIYPEIFFAPNEITWYNVPQEMDLYKQNYQLFHYNNSIELVNNTNIWIEFNAIPVSTSPPLSNNLRVYIVGQGNNDTFFNSDWTLSNEIQLIASINPRQSFNHTHTENSSHYTYMITSDENGIVGNNINITNDFWVILYSPANDISRGWKLRYHNETIANNTDNWYVGNQLGWTTTYQPGVPDAHIHMVRHIEPINDGVNITIWANDTANNVNQKSVEYFFGDIPNMPSYASMFITPLNGTSSGIINISWCEVYDPNDDNLTYTLILLNQNKSTNRYLINNSELTYFEWDTREVDNDIYDLMVIISDTEMFVNFTHSERFELFEIFNDDENPTAVIEINTENIILFNTTVMFDGSNSTDNVGIVNWTWIIYYEEMNITMHGSIINYTFENAGTYEIELIVYDADYNTDSKIIEITVKNIYQWWFYILLCVIVIMIFMILIKLIKKVLYENMK